MAHSIHAVIGFDRVAPFTLRVHFQDGTTQEIDFRPVLAGEVFGPLSEPRIFDHVRLDTESQTLVWPNGADFDPATLHDWPEEGPLPSRSSRLAQAAHPDAEILFGSFAGEEMAGAVKVTVIAVDLD